MKIYKILPIVFLSIFSRITAQNTFPATGNVGIGTSSPTSPLDVNGVIKTNGGVEVKGLDASKTYIRFSNGSTSVGMSGSAYNYTGNAADNNDFGHYVYGNNNYRLYTNGSERLRVTGGGNVGIGTSNPLAKLHVFGSEFRFEASVGRYIYSGADVLGHYIEQVGTQNSERALRLQSSNGTGTYTHFFIDGGNQKIYTSASANVGIGTSTPAYKLDVNGTVGIRSDLNMITTNTQIIGGFGASVTSGTPDWNDISNARSGNGYTLLLGSATNGSGLEPSTYYHPFSFEYSNRNGSGNMTQFAIPYTVGTNSGKLHFRARYGGVWSDWQRIPTQAQIDADYGKLIGTNNWTGSNTFSRVILNGTGADYKELQFKTGNSLRWSFFSTEAETGSNAGSNLTLNSYNDSGSFLNTILNVRRSSGNVGIGTSSPSSKFHVYRLESLNRTSLTNILTLTNQANTNPYTGHGSGILFNGSNYSTGGIVDYARISATINDNSFNNFGASIGFDVTPTNAGILTRAMTILYNGNVGIGTTTPVNTLTVQSAYSQNAIVMNLNNPYGYGVGLGAASTILRFNHTPTDAGSTGVIADIIGVSESETSSTTGALAFATRNGLSEVTTERMRINSVGNVGIGTVSPRTKLDINGNVAIGMPTDKAYPSNYKLAIGGNALAEKMVVKLQANWPDYVFHSDYALPPLSQVEEHIKAKGHLPNIPTEKEVKEIGIDLGDMNAKLLQKIEELTLYLIEIKKENELLKQRVKKLEDK